MLTVTCVRVRRERNALNTARTVCEQRPPLGGGHKQRCSPVGPGRRETLACGSGLSETEALSPPPTPSAPRTSTTARGVFQTRHSTSEPTTRGGERRTQSDVWDFLDCFHEDTASSRDARRAREVPLAQYRVAKKNNNIYLYCMYLLFT